MDFERILAEHMPWATLSRRRFLTPYRGGDNVCLHDETAWMKGHARAEPVYQLSFHPRHRLSLDGYDIRLAQYKAGPDFQTAHMNHNIEKEE